MFGSFESVCHKVAFPLCSVLWQGTPDNAKAVGVGILPVCYARAAILSNTMIFQIGNAFVHFIALFTALAIIFMVRSKYTAVGRTEMLFLFYVYTALVVALLVVDCGVAPPRTVVYLYFAAVQLGLAAAFCWTMMAVGLVGFQLWEDGTRRLLWAVRLSAAAVFAMNFVIAALTFNSWLGPGLAVLTTNTTGLYVVTYVLNAVFLFVYVALQCVLCVFRLNQLWALGAVALGVFFFVAGQVLVYVFNRQICQGLGHYIDGLFFGSLCNLFATMMVYKFWDIITDEDLEFAVSTMDTGAVPEFHPLAASQPVSRNTSQVFGEKY